MNKKLERFQGYIIEHVSSKSLHGTFLTSLLAGTLNNQSGVDKSDVTVTEGVTP